MERYPGGVAEELLRPPVGCPELLVVQSKPELELLCDNSCVPALHPELATPGEERGHARGSARDPIPADRGGGASVRSWFIRPLAIFALVAAAGCGIAPSASPSSG